MKTDCYFFSCFCPRLPLFTTPAKTAKASDATGELARSILSPENALTTTPPSLLSTRAFNTILAQQALIEKINQQRPKIYVYTDFGGGRNDGKAIGDLQTSGEICSAAWKATLQKELHLNDSATPLSITQAARRLANTFPYNAVKESPIHTIVVHVIDPGVGDQADKEHAHPRALVLRKDGVLFIGPDNGSLTLVCPDASIAGIWEIDSQALSGFTGIDFQAGGTFHGRDLFCEAAFRLAAGVASFQQIGHAYPIKALRNKIPLIELAKETCDHAPIRFETIQTDRITLQADGSAQNQLFDKTFLLGVIQSLLLPVKGNELTDSKKLFFIEHGPTDRNIAIVNNKTGNIFIGPNNGLATSFFKDYDDHDWEVFQLSPAVLAKVQAEKNNEAACALIKQQPAFAGELQEVDFLGDAESLINDSLGRPNQAQGRVWIDNYGNIKTTLQSTILDKVKKHQGSVSVILNGIEKRVRFADTFSQVPAGELFIYNGSTGVIGINPDRSKRYVEITANGTFGKFGIDYFEREGRKPQSGDPISFIFLGDFSS